MATYARETNPFLAKSASTSKLSSETEINTKSKTDGDELSNRCIPTTTIQAKRSHPRSSSIQSFATILEDDNIATTETIETKSNNDKNIKCVKLEDNSSSLNSHIELIKKLRLQLEDLEKYAYQRGDIKELTTNKEKKLDQNDELQENLSTKSVNNEERINDTAKESVDLLEEHTGSEKNVTKSQSDNNTEQPSSCEESSAWLNCISKVILATDSLVNLFTLNSKQDRLCKQNLPEDKLVESIVRKQLIPSIKSVLSFGLIEPNSRKNVSYSFFDPYYFLSSLTCLPSIDSQYATGKLEKLGDSIHVWDIVYDYYKKRNHTNSSQSNSARTLTTSFNLSESIDTPITITSKQALLIAIETTRDTISHSKPNGPEAHFRELIYKALNQGKLALWLKLIFKRSALNYYYNTSFVCQANKMDKFFEILDKLSQFKFKLETDYESTEQFESAF